MININSDFHVVRSLECFDGDIALEGKDDCDDESVVVVAVDDDDDDKDDDGGTKFSKVARDFFRSAAICK